MSKASLELGGTNWAAKDGNLLGYANGSFVDRYVPREFTFTRGSNLAATRINSAGKIEKGRENLLTYSNDFSSWSKVELDITPNQADPFGGNTATLITTTGTTFGWIRKTPSTTGVQTISFYAKAGSNTIFTASAITAPYPQVKFTLTGDGATSSNSVPIDSTITSIGNGWYRCSMTYNFTSTYEIRFYPNDTVNETIGDSAYIYGFQLEQGLVATDYIETGATTATAGLLENEPRIDYTGGTPSLLLEPQRVQLVKYSELINPTISGLSWSQVNTNTFTTNYGTAPDGTQTSTLVQFATTNSSSQLFHLVNFSAGDYTTSIYAKGSGSFKLGIFDNTNVLTDTITLTSEWQRFEVTKTALATSGGRGAWIYPNGDGDTIEIWGAQTEAGNYATSYIPTYGSAVTRNGDLMSIENLQSNNIFGTNEGTVVVDWEGITNISNSSEVTFKTSSNVEQLRIGQDSNGPLYIADRVYGQGGIYTSSGVKRRKMAFKYSAAGGLSVFEDGQKLPSTFANGDYTIDKFTINLGGVLRKAVIGFIDFFPTELSDDDCITLTT